MSVHTSTKTWTQSCKFFRPKGSLESRDECIQWRTSKGLIDMKRVVCFLLIALCSCAHETYRICGKNEEVQNTRLIINDNSEKVEVLTSGTHWECTEWCYTSHHYDYSLSREENVKIGCGR